MGSGMHRQCWEALSTGQRIGHSCRANMLPRHVATARCHGTMPRHDITARCHGTMPPRVLLETWPRIVLASSIPEIPFLVYPSPVLVECSSKVFMDRAQMLHTGFAGGVLLHLTCHFLSDDATLRRAPHITIPISLGIAVSIARPQMCAAGCVCGSFCTRCVTLPRGRDSSNICRTLHPLSLLLPGIVKC